MTAPALPMTHRWLAAFACPKGVGRCAQLLRRMIVLGLVLVGLAWGSAAQAQNCSQATTQGTAPASWKTYCWLNLGNYNDAAARTASGQNLSFALPDGSTLSFNIRVNGSTTAYNAVTAPTWIGAAVGNTAFIGIPGRPALYTTASGTRTMTISGITIVPPVGATASVFSFVVADAESSNNNERLRISTNGGGWQLLDTVPPIFGSTLPAISGVGSSDVTITGVPNTVGAHILGSNSPSTVTVETTAGGLQGVMFAVRFASILVQANILGTRVSASDQFNYQIVSNGTGAVTAGGTTSGRGNGPFTIPPLVMSAGLPLSLRTTMASGSASTLAQYATTLTCVNIAGASRPALPNNTVTSDFSLGQLQFGESLVCTYTIGAQPRMTLRKALGSGGRRFATDQFAVRIMQGTTVVATSTTTGSGGTITAGDTGAVQLVIGTAYTLDEIAAGGANLGNYSASLACSNAATGTGTTLPTSVGGIITPRPGDSITCIITNTSVSTAILVIQKTSTVISDPVNGTTNPKAIPGAIIEYTITVRNEGNRAVDANSLVILDLMPDEMALVPGTPVTFTNGSTTSGLNTFNAATMVRYASTPGTAGPFTYTPTGVADRNVRTIRIAPTGTMAAASSTASQPSFTIRFRARVE